MKSLRPAYTSCKISSCEYLQISLNYCLCLSAFLLSVGVAEGGIVPQKLGNGVKLGLVKNITDKSKQLPIVKAHSKIDAIVKAKSELHEVPPGMVDLDLSSHLKSVPLEEDGDLNNNYLQEVFFGERNDLNSLDDDEKLEKVKETFSFVDFDMNKKLSLFELETWISMNTKQHIHEAQASNSDTFTSLDKDKDGVIPWKELQKQYLIAALKVDPTANLPDEPSRDFFPTAHDRAKYLKFKSRFQTADIETHDGQLTEKEFLWFRHPEQSAALRKQMAAEMLSRLDTDVDGRLTEEEFVMKLEPAAAAAADEEDEDEEDHVINRKTAAKRRREFRTSIDLNQDGIADVAELTAYLRPHNKVHARQEARHLLERADDDEDKQLSMQEMVEHIDLILGSKLIGSSNNFHDEF